MDEAVKDERDMLKSSQCSMSPRERETGRRGEKVRRLKRPREGAYGIKSPQ